MARLVSSDPALRALLLVMQREGGMRPSEVAAALGISYTGAEKALDILVADGVAERVGHRYCAIDAPRTRAAARFAMAFLRADEVLGAIVQGNESVEFAGQDDAGVQIVLRRFTEPIAEQRLRAAIGDLAEFAPAVKVDLAHKEDLRDVLRSDLAPRRRAAGMTILVGSVDRTFPDRTKRGDLDGRPLGRMNKAVQLPSARRLREYARAHGLRRILAFGSATREDFRSDSDIDLLVESMPGRRLDLRSRVGLITEAERLFGRDVDVLTAPVRRASLAQRIERDGVVLYDAPG